MALAPGTRLGTYEVIALVGAGGMGEVYRAHDSNLRRDVALKVLPAALVADPDRVARFEREARAVAALSHPNILAIHDLGSDDSIRYAVTELLEGKTLREVLRAGPLAPHKALAIVLQIARGLEAAHARGIVHRDLKPENVFVLDDGQVKILDFGLAKATGSAEQEATNHAAADRSTTVAVVTGAGTVLGTAGYMAPEQVRGGAVDQRADIFAFGCMLFELLAGRRAFQGESSIDTLHATLHAEPPDVATLAAVPEPLSRIVGRCLEKQPANRFQTAADLRFALETIGDTSRNSAQSLPARRAVRWLRIGVAAVVIAAAAAGVWYWRGARSSAPPAAAARQARGIAVLPFDNLGEADRAYFAAGITEEVTLQLAKVSALRVIGRNAVAQFTNPAAQLHDMARELGIGAVLTGSVRHAGSQVRVGVQLLAAPGGETMWSEQVPSHRRQHLRCAERHCRPRGARAAGVARPGGTSAHPACADGQRRGLRALSAARAASLWRAGAESAGNRAIAEGHRSRSAVRARPCRAGAPPGLQRQRGRSDRVPTRRRSRTKRRADRSVPRAGALWAGPGVEPVLAGSRMRVCRCSAPSSSTAAPRRRYGTWASWN